MGAARRPGAARHRADRVEADITGSPELVRRAALAAFLDYDWELTVLDLCFDSIVDAATHTNSNRTLRFVRGDCRVRVEVHGTDRLTIDLGVEPHGDVTVTVLGRGSDATTSLSSLDAQGRSELPPGLTSLVLRWADGEHPPVRTAWVVL